MTPLLSDLHAFLVRVSEELDNHADIRDGANGKERPNWAMKLQAEIEGSTFGGPGLLSRVKQAMKETAF